MTIIPNVKIPKNLYRDLTSEATWRHSTINDEIRTRIKVTLLPSYSYNHNSPIAKRIRTGAERQCISGPQIVCKSFRTSQLTKDVFNLLQQQTGYKDDTLIKEIVARIAYTMNDPFYYEFIDREDNLVLSLFLTFLQTHDHREYCVSSRVHSQLHRLDYPQYYEFLPSQRGVLRIPPGHSHPPQLPT